MRILVKVDDENARVMEGLHNAAFDCGFTSLIWNERSKPSFDVVREFKPELVICYGSSRGSAIEAACKESSIDIVNVSPEEEACSVQFINHRPSADLLKCNQKKDKTNNIITLSEMDNRQILKISKLGLKCFSYNNRINLPCYLGTVTSEESHELLCSSKLFLLLSEDEELMCNCVASDCIPMFLGNGFFTRKVLDRYESQQEFEEQIQKLISDENYREAALKKAKEILFSNNTYHHRLSEIMEAVGKSDKAALILKRLEHYK